MLSCRAAELQSGVISRAATLPVTSDALSSISHLPSIPGSWRCPCSATAPPAGSRQHCNRETSEAFTSREASEASELFGSSGSSTSLTRIIDNVTVEQSPVMIGTLTQR